MRLRWKTTAVLTAATLALCATLLAQTRSRESEPHQHAHAQTDMSNAAREQCSMAYSSVEQLHETLTDVRQVTDAARLRTTLNAAAEPLAEARQHLGSCLDILKLMRSTAGTHAAPASHPDSAAAAPAPMPYAEPTGDAVDPICKMRVNSRVALTETYRGQKYYFCSEHDRAAFRRDPEKYRAISTR